MSNVDKNTAPPKLASWLLEIMTRRSDEYTLIGDFFEEYGDVAQREGPLKARIWFYRQILKSAPKILAGSFCWGFILFMSNIKSSLRIMTRQKLFTLINLSGMSLAITVTLLMFLYIQDEYTYDRFHENTGNIFRVVSGLRNSEGEVLERSGTVPVPMGPAIKEYFSEVTGVARIEPMYGVVRHEAQKIRELIRFTDPPFFDIFTFPLIQGDASSALSNRNSIVLTETVSARLFGNTPAVGKTVTVQIGAIENDFVVSGVLEDPPGNSTLQFSVLLNAENLSAFGNRFVDKWTGFGTEAWLLLEDPARAAAVNSRFPDFVNAFMGAAVEQYSQYNVYPEFELQPISQVRLDHSIYGGVNPVYLMILAAIAVIILVTALVNYVTLFVGRMNMKYQEIGVRKVLGAKNGNLFNQFWSESFITILTALAVALLIVYSLIPSFNTFAGKSIELRSLTTEYSILFYLFLIVMISALSSLAPAVIAGKILPVQLLRGSSGRKSRRSSLRIFVCFQFAVVVLLMISTLVMREQVSYMLSKDPGFNKYGRIVVSIQEQEPGKSAGILKLMRQNLSGYSNITNISAASHSFGRGNLWAKTHLKSGEQVRVNMRRVDENYIETMGMNLVQGRGFSEKFMADSNSVVINQKLAEKLDSENPLGRVITVGGRDLTVIGVVQDYHFSSAAREIIPSAVHLMPDWKFSYLLFSIKPGDLSGTIEYINQQWEKVQPNKPFEYSFLDKDVERMYDSEMKWSGIMSLAMFCSVFIACVGLFGVSLLKATERIKEIAVRKVLGARILGLTWLLLKEFSAVVLIANIVSWPVAYFIMKYYLENFHYRIEMSIGMFALSGIISFLFGLTAMLYTVLKSSSANPVDTLRHE